jgi:ribonuclease HI
MTTLRLTCDGSCKPNPGGQKRYTCGWHIRDDATGKLMAHRAMQPAWVPDGVTPTNNTAEFCGLTAGLQVVQELEPNYLEIRTDSSTLLSYLIGRCNRKPHLVALCQEARKILREMNIGWNAQHIPREQNEEADALSRGGKRGRNKWKKLFTAFYRGKKYKLKWRGMTKYGDRACLEFMDGSGREFWVDGPKLNQQ